MGSFFDGPYIDGELFVATIVDQTDFGFPLAVYRIAKTAGGQLVMITNNSDSYDRIGDRFDEAAFTTDNSYQIDELKFPETIANPIDPEQKLVADDDATVWFADKETLVEVFQDETWGVAYSDPPPARLQYNPSGTVLVEDPNFARNGFYFKAPDGTIRSYVLAVPFVSDRVLTGASWQDGGGQASGYSYADAAACSAANVAAVMPNTLEADLEEVGTVSYGNKTETLWGVSNDHEILSMIFDHQDVISDYEEFVASRPVFFWKDAFGRIIKFLNVAYLPC